MNSIVPDEFIVWQDREIRFDLPFSQLQPRKGEYEVDSINAVEDTKGNNGERGALTLTNLRIIWLAHKDPKTNLSIGFNCITSVNVRNVQSRLRGSVQGLNIMTKYQNSRFEFIFTSLVKGSPRLFTSMQAVHKAYESTKLYRDLKLRGAIIKDKQLILLPDEQIFSKVDGVWNLSSDQGNLGTFFITNLRVVWHANLAENFNVSIPYLQIKGAKVRDSKFGHALVIETSARSGGYILGFRIDPQEKLAEVFKEVKALLEVFVVNPKFGIKYTVEEKPTIAETKSAPVVDDVEIIQEDRFDAIARSYSESAEKTADREPIFSPELGLAVEKLRDGVTIDGLWFVST